MKTNTGAAGQVLRRLQLTAWVEPGSLAQNETAFKTLVAGVAIFWTVQCILYYKLYASIFKPLDDNTVAYSYLLSASGLVFTVVEVVLLYKLRSHVRQRYAIPGSKLEDGCCSFWCGCCVASQLLRHTTDYDVYPSRCCTETGLPPLVNPPDRTECSVGRASMASEIV
jgi:hypothetical protein